MTQIAYADAASILVAVNKEIINPFITLLFAVAILAFIWGLVEFIQGSDNEEKKTKGQQHMLWSILGMVVMVSAIGIMHLIVNSIS
ncbi:MAG: hypothetical protein KBB88_01795 [Candidatus Pacebacteria bacterium]|nr:hypothetical protein [Candidatus Paceibacterota bacterium]